MKAAGASAFQLAADVAAWRASSGPSESAITAAARTPRKRVATTAAALALDQRHDKERHRAGRERDHRDRKKRRRTQRIRKEHVAKRREEDEGENENGAGHLREMAQ